MSRVATDISTSKARAMAKILRPMANRIVTMPEESRTASPATPDSRFRGEPRTREVFAEGDRAEEGAGWRSPTTTGEARSRDPLRAPPSDHASPDRHVQEMNIVYPARRHHVTVYRPGPIFPNRPVASVHRHRHSLLGHDTRAIHARVCSHSLLSFHPLRPGASLRRERRPSVAPG